VEENLEEKEFMKGLLGMSPEVEWEIKEGSRREIMNSSQPEFLFV
jgi:hypothetical protein